MFHRSIRNFMVNKFFIKLHFIHYIDVSVVVQIFNFFILISFFWSGLAFSMILEFPQISRHLKLQNYLHFFFYLGKIRGIFMLFCYFQIQGGDPTGTGTGNNFYICSESFIILITGLTVMIICTMYTYMQYIYN